jgi:hypothetical protein
MLWLTNSKLIEQIFVDSSIFQLEDFSIDMKDTLSPISFIFETFEQVIRQNKLIVSPKESE